MTIFLLLFLVLLVVILVIGAANTVNDDDLHKPLPAFIVAFFIVIAMLVVFGWGMEHGKAKATGRTLTISQPTINPADTDRKQTP